MIILALFLLPPLLGQAAFPPANGLLALYAVKLAFRYKPALAANCAQDPAAGYFFAESAHELLLGFIGP
jgi:hypothetical protein